MITKGNSIHSIRCIRVQKAKNNRRVKRIQSILRAAGLNSRSSEMVSVPSEDETDNPVMMTTIRNPRNIDDLENRLKTLEDFDSDFVIRCQSIIRSDNELQVSLFRIR